MTYLTLSARDAPILEQEGAPVQRTLLPLVPLLVFAFALTSCSSAGQASVAQTPLTTTGSPIGAATSSGALPSSQARETSTSSTRSSPTAATAALTTSTSTDGTGSTASTPSSDQPTGGGVIQPDDTVICRQLLDGKTMTISRYQPETDKEELVRSISLGDINNLQPGWKLLVGCGHSLSWSPDFTKLLVTGRTNQAELSAQAGGFHVFLIDFSQTTITDLTAARQTSGFSAAAAVNDTMPGFVSENATNKVSIGSNMVMFSDNGIPKILDVQSPKGVTPADVTPSAIKLHPEYRLWLQGGGEFNAVSPDGKYLFERGTGITPAGDYSAVGTACPGVERPDIIGWTDSTHVVVTYGQYVGLMAVKDLGLSCESLIPAIGEGKTIGPVELMLDRQHISVALSGGELYSISTSLPASEPKAIQPPRLPDSLVVLFRPGNY